MGVEAGYPVVQGPGQPTGAVGIQAPPPQPQHVPIGMPGLYPQPVQGVPIKGPARAPGQTEVVLGYEICEPRTGCCQCTGLSQAGVLAVIILIIFCPIIAWIPCMMESCFEKFQRPVYGQPGTQVPIANLAGHPGYQKAPTVPDV